MPIYDSISLSDDASEYNGRWVSIPAEPAYYMAIHDASEQYALDPKLFATIIYIESGGNVMAVSPKGAKGLMQPFGLQALWCQ
jgi:soluble lytic murein transglycosylase-like protein